MIPTNWHEDVLSFWFEELSPKQWYVADDKLDELITSRFGELVEDLSKKLPEDVKSDVRKCLATIICFDQFTRNIHRGSGRAFAHDHIALDLAKHIRTEGWDADMEPQQKQFSYMPFMHAEDLQMQEISMELFSQLGEEATGAAKDHFEIIEKFGRYPHRNEVLGRFSSPEELEYLKNGKRFGQ